MDMIFYIGYAVVDIINFILAFKFLFGGKIKNNPLRMVVSFAILIVLQGINFKFLGINRDFLDVILGLIIIIFLSDGKLVRRLIIYFDSYMVSSIAGTFCLYVCCFALEKEQQEIVDDLICSILVNCVFMIFIILYLMFRKNNKNSSALIEFSTKQQALLTVALFCCTAIIGTTQIFSDRSNMPLIFKNFLGISLSALCVFFVMVLIWLTNSIRSRDYYLHQKEISALRILEQEKRYDIIKKSDEDIRRFRHDIKGHMIVLQNYIRSKDYAGAEDYLNKIGGKIESVENKIYTGIVVVDAVIDNYAREMISKNIEFKWIGNTALSEKNIEIFDLCSLFENILINAIEACEKCDKNRIVNISLSILNNKLCIIEKNSMQGDVIFDNYENPITTKADKNNHGIGTKNIKSIVDGYNGTIRYKCEAGWFELVIQI